MAVTLYTDKATLARGVAPGEMPLSHVASTSQDEAISDASRLADSYLSKRYTLPLLTVGRDLYLRVGDIATWYLLRGRLADVTTIRLSYEDAIRWLEQVAAGKIDPDVTDSASGATEQPASPRASVRSATGRGFTSISGSNTTGANPRAGGWPDGSR